jgi:hypothetical protein
MTAFFTIPHRFAEPPLHKGALMKNEIDLLVIEVKTRNSKEKYKRLNKVLF